MKEVSSHSVMVHGTPVCIYFCPEIARVHQRFLPRILETARRKRATDAPGSYTLGETETLLGAQLSCLLLASREKGFLNLPPGKKQLA